MTAGAMYKPWHYLKNQGLSTNVDSNYGSRGRVFTPKIINKKGALY